MIVKYRKFGRLDWKASVLGFGAMRLPESVTGESKQIDEELATRMVRTGIDRGINYVDTAWGYHGGESEKFVGRVLQDGYREKVRIATKLPSWLIKEPSDMDRFFNEQLERLQTDRIDLYLLHSLNKDHWPKLRDMGVTTWAERLMAEGKIGCLGFSFHDELSVFKQIVDDYDNWTFCQIQYNYVDIEHQAGTEGLKYAADKGLAVVVMEPIRGGRLSNNVPQSIQEILDSASTQRTPADWALQWVWNQPEVNVVLSGMSNMEHVLGNLDSADRAGVNSLTQDELSLLTRARAKFIELAPIPCTNCQYCIPCPNGVNIPRIFEIYNEVFMYNSLSTSKMLYSWLEEAHRASACIECGECEQVCPQDIEIIDWLSKAHETLAESA